MQKDNRFTSYALIFLGLTLLVFFARWAYADLQIKQSEQALYEASTWDKSISKQNETREKLDWIKAQMKDPWSDISMKIAKYTKELYEDELLNYFYGYAEWVDWWFDVQGLRIDRRKANDYGFGEATVNLEVVAEDSRQVMEFLRMILDENADYRFFIDSFDLPDPREDEPLSFNIPLNIFYK